MEKERWLATSRVCIEVRMTCEHSPASITVSDQRSERQNVGDTLQRSVPQRGVVFQVREGAPTINCALLHAADGDRGWRPHRVGEWYRKEAVSATQ